MLAIMMFHLPLSLARCNISLDLISVLHLLATCFLKLPKNVFLCLPLSLFLSIFPVSTKFSSPSFLTTCHRNSSCRLRIVLKRVLFVPALFSTSSFVTRSVQGILCIFLKNHISAASNLFSIAPDIVQLSQPYSRVDIT